MGARYDNGQIAQQKIEQKNQKTPNLQNKRLMNIKDSKPRAQISTVTGFVEGQSDAESKRFVFAYTITIENTSENPFQLMSRHWLIEDANSKVEEVIGEGVIGEQPVILPGEQFTYSSGAVLQTEIGTMKGRYFMRGENDEEFEVEIPRFVLSVPRTLHWMKFALTLKKASFFAESELKNTAFLACVTGTYPSK